MEEMKTETVVTEEKPVKKTARRRVAKKTPVEEIKEEVATAAATTPSVAKPKRASRKKAEKPVEQPVEQPTEQPVAEEKPVKKTAKKKAEKPAEETAKKPAPKRTKKAKAAEEKAEPAEETPAETPKTEEVKTLTRAEKKDAVKAYVRELLKADGVKWAELLELAAKWYQTEYPAKENEKISDVKGRIGSVIDLMKKEGEVAVENGVARLVSLAETKPEPAETEMKPESAEQPTGTPMAAASEPTTAVVVAPETKPAPVYDLTGIFDRKKPPVAEPKKEKPAEVKETVERVAQEKQSEEKQTKKPEPKKEEKKEPKKPVAKRVTKARLTGVVSVKTDPLKDAFLKQLRHMSGEYFEYYTVYLLERYSRKNGMRLEGMRVSGGDRDGGIDGEIEVTNKLGFRETIYIQAKNWKPTDEKHVVGETLVQQFIGAVTYRQAVEHKQHCRGIFITTSYFTGEAKDIFNRLSDKFVGYDGDDLYEAAKECSFGLIEKDGVWEIDEYLLSGEDALYYMR